MMGSHITIWDYGVFFLVLLISAIIGLYSRFTGGKQRTLQEYLLANGQLSAVPVAFSLTASFMSAITLLGVSAEIYNYGTQFLLINFAYVIGTPILCYVFLPVFYKMRCLSIYEYLERRFGKLTRIIASVTFLLQMVMYTGITLYAPAIALSAVTGFDKDAGIFGVGAVCTFYSAIGGMKAVVLTDVFQSILMIAAMLSVLIQGIIEFNGIEHIWNIARNGSRIEFLNLGFDDRNTVYTQIFGGIFVFLSLYAVNQAQVQRLLSTKDLPTARKSVWYSLPILMILSFTTGFVGLVIYARYKDCDPILNKRIESPDQLLPLFVAESFQHIPGLTGLFVSGILSGSLSTVSSSINSLAAVTFEDYIRPLLKSHNPRATTASLITKAVALFYGSTCVGLAYLADYFSGLLQASLTIFGVVGGPMVGLFFAGMIFPFSSQFTVVPAFTVALIFTSWIGFGGPKPPPTKLYLGDMCGNVSADANNLMITSDNENYPEYFYFYRIPYQFYPIIGFLLTILITMVLSIFIKRKTPLDLNLLAPPISRVYERQLFKQQGNQCAIDTV